MSAWRRAGRVARRSALILALAASLLMLDDAARTGVAAGTDVAPAAQAQLGSRARVPVLATTFEAIERRISTWPDADVEAAILVAFGLLLLYAASLVGRGRRRHAPRPDEGAGTQPSTKLVPFPPHSSPRATL